LSSPANFGIDSGLWSCSAPGLGSRAQLARDKERAAAHFKALRTKAGTWDLTEEISRREYGVQPGFAHFSDLTIM